MSTRLQPGQGCAFPLAVRRRGCPPSDEEALPASNLWLGRRPLPPRGVGSTGVLIRAQQQLQVRKSSGWLVRSRRLRISHRGSSSRTLSVGASDPLRLSRALRQGCQPRSRLWRSALLSEAHMGLQGDCVGDRGAGQAAPRLAGRLLAGVGLCRRECSRPRGERMRSFEPRLANSRAPRPEGGGR